MINDILHHLKVVFIFINKNFASDHLRQSVTYLIGRYDQRSTQRISCESVYLKQRRANLFYFLWPLKSEDHQPFKFPILRIVIITIKCVTDCL